MTPESIAALKSSATTVSSKRVHGLAPGLPMMRTARRARTWLNQPKGCGTRMSSRSRPQPRTACAAHPRQNANLVFILARTRACHRRRWTGAVTLSPWIWSAHLARGEDGRAVVDRRCRRLSAVIEAGNNFGRFFTGQVGCWQGHSASSYRGAGGLNLAAVGTATSLGAITYAFDVPKSLKNRVDGAELFIWTLRRNRQTAPSGGYASVSSKFKRAQLAGLGCNPEVDIVITTTLIPGRDADFGSPIWLFAEAGLGVVDLTASEVATRPDQNGRKSSLTTVSPWSATPIFHRGWQPRPLRSTPITFAT